MTPARDGRAGLILQARMGSTRLPGKSLMPLAGAPLLERLLERVRRCTGFDVIVVATTRKPEDDVLSALARRCGVEVFRGSENDLVSRYLEASRAFGIDVIARLPADNPVAEPEEVDRILAYHRTGAAEFSSNLAQVFGNGYPDGIGAEVFDRTSLEEVEGMTTGPGDREHPHLNFFDYATQRPRHPERFRVGTIECPVAFRRPDLVLDVNTLDQYRYLSRLYADLYPANPRFHISDIIRWHDETWARGRADRSVRV